jgi:mRNA-degrading endonuclease RelE of RelBE toxin-antitoxin system
VERKGIEWKDRAKSQLRSIDRMTALGILHTLDAFCRTGAGDVQRLQYIEPPEFRLRVGDYRVRYHELGGTIVILSVKHRREAYR